MTASTPSLEAAVLQWWRDRAAGFERRWFGAGQAELYEALQAEAPLLDALLDAGAAQPRPGRDRAILEVLIALWPMWSAVGAAEGESRIRRALSNLGRAPGYPGLRVRAYDALAWLALDIGDVARADDAIQAGDAIGRAAAEQFTPMHARVRAVRDLYAGRARAAQVALEAVLAKDTEDGFEGGMAIDLSFLAAASSLSGDQAASYAACERALGLCEGQGEKWFRNYIVWAFALAAWRDGDRARARILAREGLEDASRIGDRHAAAFCADVLGWWEASDGDGLLGARLLGIADSLRMHVDEPENTWETRAHRDDAAARGKARFGGQFASTRARSRLHADDSWKSEIQRLLVPTASARVLSASLSAREMEIAHLITDGRSNKEIARMLLISVRTVETHIANIFAKLDVSSRAQIAAWVSAQRPGITGR